MNQPQRQAPASPPRLAVTAREAATMLSLSEKTIKRMIDRGELPYTKLGTRLLISCASLEAWLASHQAYRGSEG